MLHCLALVAHAAKLSAEVLPALSGGPMSPDGVHLRQGGWRIEAFDGSVVWSDEAFVGELLAFTAIDGGWLFVAEDGVVATSVGFTGPLVRVAQLPSAVKDVVTGNGRLTIRDAAGRYWISDGGAPALLSGPPNSGTVLSAAFLDRSRGALITDGGSAWTTTDGGSSWTRAGHGPYVELGVFLASEDRVQVITATRPDTKKRAELMRGDVVPERVVLTAAQLASLDDGYVTRTTRHYGDFEVKRPDGSVWRLGEDNGLVRLDDSGATSLLPPPPTEGRCLGMAAWGAEVVTTCGILAGPKRLFATEGTAWRALGTFDGFGLVADPEGTYLAVAAACPGAPQPNVEDGLGGLAGGVCATADGGETWLPVEVPGQFGGGFDALRQLADGKLVYRGSDYRDGGMHDVWTIADLATGGAAVVEMPADQPPGSAFARVRMANGQVVATLAVTSEHDAPAYAVAIGVPRNLEVRALPEGAVYADLRDGKVGLAVGGTAAYLWTTRNGGASWKALPTGIDGDASTVVLRGAFCGTEGCIASGASAVLRVAEGKPARALAPTEPLAEPPERPDGKVSVGALSCTQMDEPKPSTALPAAVAGVKRGDARGADVDAAVDLTPVEGGTPTAVVRWADDQGVHASAPFPATQRLRGAPSVIAAVPDGVFVAYGDARWWVKDGQAAVQVELPDRYDIEVALSDRAGGLWIGAERSDHPAIGVHIAADGTSSTVARVTDPRAAATHLGWDAGPVLARATGADPFPIEVIGLDDAYTVRTIAAPGTLEACSGPPAERQFYLSLQEDTVTIAWSGEPAFALVDVAETACVREIRQGSSESGWDVVARPVNGTWVGTDLWRRPVACTFTGPASTVDR